ncbi:phage major capsid protein [Proteiniclasticum ruminis]|uniref:Phage major capsid protein, HK97 family n=1 Tax=Proteiniclasticum ruminis TaxID=398199 RepID=A0A1I4ZM31_9CLOT|nr:phage major capsid protein [Proteiniclasticum ruminis]SFN51258.1 phage major capsid protein, HK97 family [Proteiniclasticum ruminis]
MNHPDNQKFMEIKNKMQAAIANGDTEGFTASMDDFAKEIQNSIIEDAKMASRENLSMNALYMNKEYNLRPLTSEEEKFYMAVEGNTFANTPMPKTVFDRVFEDLRKDHSLLSRIQFVNVTGVTEWSMRNGDVQAAQWGKLCDSIKKQLDMAFKVENITLNKLSAFVNMCKAMIKLGPVWLDRFVREMLMESVQLGAENAVVAGNGLDQPIGMMKNLAAPVDPVTGYADKAATAITDLTPATIGRTIVAPMTKNGTVKVDVADILFMVNPLDYWQSIFSELAFRTPEGNYVLDKTSIGATLVQSAAVPAGKMIVGKAKNYFFGLGMNTKIDVSDEYRFLEDDRVYIARLYGHGKPVDNDSFAIFDITGVNPVTP